MDIILVSNKFAKARTLRLTGPRIAMIATFAFLLLIVAAILTQYAIVRFKPGLMSDGLRSWLASAQAEEQKRQLAYQRESLDTMAKRLGQMQAQLQRLDAMGIRLVKLTGMKPQEFSFSEVPPQGGPYIPAPAVQQQDMTLEGMGRQLASLNLAVDDRNDKLVALETLLMQDRSNKWLIPSVTPIKEGWYSSNFGWRIDPFTGKNAMHEGVDYVVPEGTAVYASAGGVVDYADTHPQYGNMVEIDHGNGVITRYAHNSKLLVKVGQMVKRGQKISLSGSTGRSTGNHLHFEVRYKGVAQNPVRFLEKAQKG